MLDVKAAANNVVSIRNEWELEISCINRAEMGGEGNTSRFRIKTRIENELDEWKNGGMRPTRKNPFIVYQST